MKRNSLSLHKTRRVIAGLLVSAILALTLFATALNGFAANHKKGGGASKCAEHVTEAQAALQKPTPDVPLALTHIGFALSCLQPTGTPESGPATTSATTSAK